MKPKALFAVCLCLLLTLGSRAQEPPFYSEIRAFRQQDSLHFPPRNEILFVGSSTFRIWQDVQQAFPSYPIINRGFGGSTLPDVIRYAGSIIYPYHLKQVVIYCGDNDLASSDTVSAKTVYDRFVTLFQLIRSHLPAARVTFVSIKPSPSREKLLPKMDRANRDIRHFIQMQKNASFIDVYHPMLDKTGKPIRALFRDDMLHMNAKGYALWQRVLRPYLLK